MSSNYRCALQAVAARGVLCFALMIAMTSLSAADAPAPAPAPVSDSGSLDADATLAKTLRGTIWSAHLLHNKVNLRVDLSDPNNVRYFLEPYIYPDWEGMSNNLDKLCGPTDGSKVVSIVMNVEMFSKKVVDEFIDQSRSWAPAKFGANEFLPPVTSSNVYVYPWRIVEIFVDAQAGQQRRIYSTPVPPNGNLLNRYTPPSNPSIHLSGTCDGLRTMVDTYDVYGTVSTTTRPMRSVWMSARMQAFGTSKVLDELVSKATAGGYIETTSKSHGSGGGLSIGPVNFGGSSSGGNTKTTDTRRRAVSANVVADGVANYVASIAAACYSETEACSQAQVDALLQAVLAKSTAVEAKFNENADGTFRLATSGFTGSLSKSDLDMLIETSDAPQVKSSHEMEGKYAGVEGKDKQTLDVIDSRSVKWHRKADNDWVPTSVTLHILDQKQLQQDLKVTQVNVIVDSRIEDKPLPLSVIRPETVIRSAVDDAVEETQAELRDDLEFAMKGPPKRVFVTKTSAFRPGVKWPDPWVMWCQSEVKNDDLDIQASENPVPALNSPEGLVRINLIQGLDALADPFRHECRQPVAVGKQACFVDAYWLKWYLMRTMYDQLIPQIGTICTNPAFLPHWVPLGTPPPSGAQAAEVMSVSDVVRKVRYSNKSGQ